MNTGKPVKVVTGRRTVMSYLNVMEPRDPFNSGRPRYSVSLIIPKDDCETVEKIRAGIREAYEQGEATLRGGSGRTPALEAIHTPLRDGDLDRPHDPAYQNCWFITASNSRRPGVFDARRQPILDPDELYSGIIGRASLNFFAYNRNGSRGIAAGLNAIQKLADGTPLGGGGRPEDDFDDGDGDGEFLG